MAMRDSIEVVVEANAGYGRNDTSGSHGGSSGFRGRFGCVVDSYSGRDVSDKGRCCRGCVMSVVMKERWQRVQQRV